MIGCIIQARTGSSRLPGKAMKLLDGKYPILYYVVSQLQHSKLLDDIVIATTDLKEDDVIVKFAQENGFKYFRGSEKDVLDRHYQCAKKFAFSTIVRIPSDKPLIDPQILDKVVEVFTTSEYDYVSNFLHYTFPYGTEVEVFSFEALEKAWKLANLPSEREHVTPYIYNHRNEFKIFNVINSEDLSHLRWEVDREKDLELVKIIVERIKSRPIILKDIMNLYEQEPTLFNINRNDNPNEGYLKSLKDDEEFVKQEKRNNG
jgi:spore coat polysaccharide biosynthesis protein SpsF (cytidylyltransferase family)